MVLTRKQGMPAWASPGGGGGGEPWPPLVIKVYIQGRTQDLIKGVTAARLYSTALHRWAKCERGVVPLAFWPNIRVGGGVPLHLAEYTSGGGGGGGSPCIWPNIGGGGGGGVPPSGRPLRFATYERS